MKILIDGQTLLTADINRGIGKYFINTIENILQYDFTNDFYLTGSPATNLSFFSPWAREKSRMVFTLTPQFPGIGKPAGSQRGTWVLFAWR